MPAGRKSPALPFRLSCKLCAQAASLWLSWFFPVLSPAEGGKARWRLTTVRSFIPTWRARRRNQCHARGEWKVTVKNYVPVPSIFRCRSEAVGLTLLCGILVCVSVWGGRGRRHLHFAALFAITSYPLSSGKLVCISKQLPFTTVAERSQLLMKISLCKTSC